MGERPPTHDRSAKLDTGKRRQVGLAVVNYGEANGRSYAVCSCGQPFTQAREKVREDAIDRHFERKHAGRGIRI